MAGLGAGGAAGGGGPLAGLAAAVATNGLLAIAAGLIVGVIGSGTLLATGAVHVGGGKAAPAAAPVGLQLVACPDAGPVIGSIPRGEKVLVTGKSADGAWLQVFYPGPAFDRAWTKAGPLQLEADASTLPVASCEAPATPTPRPTPGASTAVVESPAVSPSPEPSPSPAASQAPSPSPSLNPSPSPSPSPGASPLPSPSPTPKPTPNAPPVIAAFTASTQTLSYDQGAYCPTAPKSVTFTVKASDAGGIATATLYWKTPGAASYTPAPMSLASGSAQNGTWTATLDTTANGITSEGTLAYYAIVLDASGAKAKSPATSALAIPVSVCVNTGPTFTNGPDANPSAIYWVPPLGATSCASASDITVGVQDVDGITSVDLKFRFNGGSWQSKAMDSNTVPGKWYANLDTLGDKFPGTSGQIDYYVVAVDGKNLANQSGGGTIAVTYCDTPAVFSQPTIQSRAITVPGPTGAYDSIFGSVGVTDRNVANSQQLKVTIHWQLLDSGGAVVLSGIADANWDGQFYWSVQTSAAWGSALGPKASGRFIWWAESTDPFGGSTDSRNQPLRTPGTLVNTL